MSDFKEWCELHQLDPSPTECVKCKNKYPFTKIVQEGDFVGIGQEPHECGEEFAQAKFRILDKEFLNEIGALFERLKKNGGSAAIATYEEDDED